MMWMGDVVRAGTVKGWRCLLCGEATDPGIEANRKKPPLLAKGRPPVTGLNGMGQEKKTLRQVWV